MEKLKVKILSSYYSTAFARCVEIVANRCEIIGSNFDEVDLIVCPDYDSIIHHGDILATKYGALVFHPSPLPRMKGKNAIKRQYAAGDKVGGGTWFWAGKMIDGGDICEQEVCIIDMSVRPREYYEKVIIPIMERGLVRALDGIMSGHARRVPQITTT